MNFYLSNISKKLLAVVLSMSILVSVVSVTLFVTNAVTEEPAAQSQAVDAKYSTYLYDFETPQTGFAALYDDEYAHANVTATYSAATDAALTGNVDNNVGLITGLTQKGDTAPGDSNLSEMYGPVDDIVRKELENNKYLSAGSFDFHVGNGNRRTQLYVFGINKETYQTIRITRRSNTSHLYWQAYNHSTSAETNTATSGYLSNNVFNAASDAWVHVEFSYNANNQLLLKFYDSDNTSTIKNTGLTIPPENRIFAVNKAWSTSNSTKENKSAVLRIDNLQLNFIPNIEPDIEYAEYDFDNNGFTELYSDKYLHANVTNSYSTATAKALTDNDSNKVGRVTSIDRSTGSFGNFGQMYGPVDDIATQMAEKGKYIASGSFDFRMPYAGQFNNVFVFGIDDTHHRSLSIGAQYNTTTFVANTYEVSREAEAAVSSETPTNKYSEITATGHAWYHAEFSYSDDNKLSVTISNADNTASVVLKNNVLTIAPKDRVFAVTTSRTYKTSTNYDLIIDNVNLKFTKGGAVIEESKYLSGDANNDGIVNVVDLFRAKRYLKNSAIGIMEPRMALVDDDVVDSKDYEALRQFFVDGGHFYGEATTPYNVKEYSDDNTATTFYKVCGVCGKTSDETFTVALEAIENYAPVSPTVTLYETGANLKYGLTWNCNSNPVVPGVYIREKGTEEYTFVSAKATKETSANDTTTSKTFYVCKAVIELKPATEYEYYITDVCSNVSSEVFEFTSVNESAETITFASVSDTQNSGNIDTGVPLSNIFTKMSNVDFLLHSGDICQYTEYEQSWTNMLNTNRTTLAGLPVMFGAGNHDTIWGASPNCITRHFNYNLPKQSSTAKGFFHSFDYADARFVIINTNVRVDASTETEELAALSAEQYAWLESTLKSNTKKWLFVMMHNPMYSAGKYGVDTDVYLANGFKKQLTDLFVECGVDLVLQGHEHTYSKTYPVTGVDVVDKTAEIKTENDVSYTVDPKGPIFVINGPAGNQEKAIDSAYNKDLYEYASNGKEYSWTEYSITGNRLTVEIKRYDNGNAITVHKWGIEKN